MTVIDALEEAKRTFGLPQTIRVDNGCQFTSKELDLWAYANSVTLDFPGREHQPTTPTQKVSMPPFGSSASARTGLWIWTTPS